MEGLKQLPLAFVGTVTARSDSTSGIPILTETTTRISLTFTVDRILRDENASGIAVGAPFTVGAFKHSNSFLGGTNASGNSNVPIVGDRVRVFASNDVESCHPAGLKWAVEYPNGFQPILRIGFFSGDDEYRSEITMPMIAKSLSKELSIDCPTIDVPKKDPPSYCMISMRRADAIVFFMRWRDLSSSDCEEIEEALGSGLPIVGLRTSTHAFAMPAKSQWIWMNEGFPLQVWGQKWLTHQWSHKQDARARGRWIGEGSSDPAWNHWKFRSSELALLRRTVAERCEGPLMGRVDQQRAGGGDFSSPANSLGARTKRAEATAGSMVEGANESIFGCRAERSTIARAESYGVLHAWPSKRFRKCSSAPNCRADDLVGDRSSRNDSS